MGVEEAFIEDYASAWLARWWATGTGLFSPMLSSLQLPAFMFELWIGGYDERRAA
jgi:hypothetical protein